MPLALRFNVEIINKEFVDPIAKKRMIHKNFLYACSDIITPSKTIYKGTEGINIKILKSSFSIQLTASKVEREEPI